MKTLSETFFEVVVEENALKQTIYGNKKLYSEMKSWVDQIKTYKQVIKDIKEQMKSTTDKVVLSRLEKKISEYNGKIMWAKSRVKGIAGVLRDKKRNYIKIAKDEVENNMKKSIRNKKIGKGILGAAGVGLGYLAYKKYKDKKKEETK